ncbi:MAG: uroporphyrinogen-III C-methyltransferase [Candidatus Accumulibacter sp.]|jgi:uroporphyrin-3 C-methyltransferase|nr:uroporphyrinogen-III C-methyltransferase [Accumulibacter sp.]
MNDEISSEALPQSPAAAAPAAAESSPPPAPPAASPAGSGKSGFSPWLLLAVLALGLAGWQWMETRLRLAETQQEMTRRLSESDAVASEGRMLAKQAQERLTVLQGKLGELEGRLAESKSQQEILENLYQNLARGNEESVLAEVEQSVTLASQQLQLAGNLQGAILALEAADARLADSSQPQFINLRKVLTHDLERLRALPQLDLPGMYLRLENVIDTLDALPLAVISRARDESPAGTPAESPPLLSTEYWRALAADFWREMRGLVRIQRIDRAEPALLPPGQDFFLRENLRLRLLNARLALFARDQQTYRNDLERSRAWIERYFDGNEKIVQNSLRTLRQLAATEISVVLPSLNESVSAIKLFRAEKEQR